MSSRTLGLLLLVLLSGLLVLPAFSAPEDEIASVVSEATKAFVRNDAEAVRPLLMDGSVLLIEGAGMDGAMVASGEQMLEMMAQMPVGTDTGVTVTLIKDKSEINPDIAFVQAEVSNLPDMPGKLTSVGVLVNVAGEWRIALMGALPEGTAKKEMPAAIRDIVADLAGGETTGMQSAVTYLPTGPCLFIVGGPEFLIPMVGADAVRRQVAEWALPANVKAEGEAKAVVGTDIAFVVRGSTFETEGFTRLSRDMLCLHKENGKWKIVAFIARSAPTGEKAAEGAEPEAKPGAKPEGEAKAP